MENTREYFCWVRAADVPATQEVAELTVQRSADYLPATDLSTMSQEEAILHLRRSCPAVTQLVRTMHKDAPAPPTRALRVGPMEQRTRMVFAAEQMTTVHLERPVAPFELSIEIWPIFGSRMEALEWIESKPGRQFSDGAKALSLLCFAVMSVR